MATVEISVQGLSLWIRRSTYWEVLFPQAVTGNDQHEPYVTIFEDGVLQGNRRQNFTGHTLLTTGLVANAPHKPNSVHWQLRLFSSELSPVWQPDPAASSQVIASLILPLQQLERFSAIDLGPVSFNGERYSLDYGTSVRLTNREDAILWQRVKTQTTGETELARISASAARVEILIENLTSADQKDCGETKHREHLMEADDLLALCDMQVSVPRYFGDDRKKECARIGLAATRGTRWESVWRLCPQGFCENCPPD